MKSYELMFNQGIWESNLPLNEEEKVIYFFYKTIRKDDGKNYLDKLLYIGKSIDASTRLTKNHEKISLAQEKIEKNNNENLYISYAILDSKSFATNEDVYRAESCLIFNLKPELNDAATVAFHWDETEVSVGGTLAKNSEKKVFKAKEA